MPAAAEVSYEKDFKDAICAVFDEADVTLGSASETRAILRELPQPHTRLSPIAVYVNGRLTGYVGSPYADSGRKLLRQLH